MELTLDQALQKGIEAHKAGKAQEADQYYTAILKANPKHPDANHNMGVLAVGIGKVGEALPFFKTALEVNPSIDQFWLSFIDALIKLGRLEDAKTVFDQAKSKDFRGNGFDQLEQSLAGLDKSIEVNPASQKSSEPPNDQLQSLLKIYTQGQYQKALMQASQLLEEFPRSVNLCNIIGIVYKGLGKLDEAIEAYKKAISIKPDFTQAFNNMGIALKERGDLIEAVNTYKNSIAISAGSFSTYNNLGNALKELGKLDEAKQAYEQALSLNPSNSEIHNNMGVILQEKGLNEKAKVAYKKALSINRDNNEAKLNLTSLLKLYSPNRMLGSHIIMLDNQIKFSNNHDYVEKTDKSLASDVKKILTKIHEAEPDLRTDESQIYKRNKINLNCKRHQSIFAQNNIIPEHCFGCFKVQVEVENVIQLIRLVSLFYKIKFKNNLTRKCMIEMRPKIQGKYKGLVFCKGLDQAKNIKNQLEKNLIQINKSLSAKIKRGCSEFSLSFPSYNVDEKTNNQMQYPSNWRKIEKIYDEKYPMEVNDHSHSSINQFCLNDYLIIHNWIDYAKGINDPTAGMFSEIPIKYYNTHMLAQKRLLRN